MVMCDNEFETKEIKFEPRIKLNHNIYKGTTSDQGQGLMLLNGTLSTCQYCVDFQREMKH